MKAGEKLGHNWISAILTESSGSWENANCSPEEQIEMIAETNAIPSMAKWFPPSSFRTGAVAKYVPVAKEADICV